MEEKEKPQILPVQFLRRDKTTGLYVPLYFGNFKQQEKPTEWVKVSDSGFKSTECQPKLCTFKFK